jgi:rod shape-determining protein MreC
MRNFFHFIIKYHFILLFLLLEIVSFYLVVNFNSYQRASWISSSSNLSGGVYRSFSDASQYLKLQQINEELANENTYLRSQLPSSYKDSKDYFSLVYDSLNKRQYTYRTAKVINNSVNKHFNYITLNKGLNNGIEKEMGVISSKGVVGIVKDVSGHYSSVISILNTRLLISGKLKESGFFGALGWDGKDYRYAWLNEIPIHAPVAVGDLVVTSGFSSIFPEGILIGSVETVEKEEGESFYRIKVKLSVDFKDLSYVELISNNMRDEQLKLENSND